MYDATPALDLISASASPGIFATTHWSVVLAAGQSDSQQATAALEKLCRTYWYPLYAYVRRRGSGPEDAEDRTQSFFARLLERDFLSQQGSTYFLPIGIVHVDPKTKAVLT